MTYTVTNTWTDESITVPATNVREAVMLAQASRNFDMNGTLVVREDSRTEDA